MTTPTLSMQMFGQSQWEIYRKRQRSEAAKKAWKTRRRLARPTPTMRKWLEWLARRPENVIVQRREDYWGSSFSFGAYPETSVPSYSPQFTRTTFYPLQKRGWIEAFHRTKECLVGKTLSENGEWQERYGFRVYWRITNKGKAVLAKAKV